MNFFLSLIAVFTDRYVTTSNVKTDAALHGHMGRQSSGGGEKTEWIKRKGKQYSNRLETERINVFAIATLEYDASSTWYHIHVVACACAVSAFPDSASWIGAVSSEQFRDRSCSRQLFRFCSIFLCTYLLLGVLISNKFLFLYSF